jgi:hypothetical protein
VEEIVRCLRKAIIATLTSDAELVCCAGKLVIATWTGKPQSIFAED